MERLLGHATREGSSSLDTLRELAETHDEENRQAMERSSADITGLPVSFSRAAWAALAEVAVNFPRNTEDGSEE